MALPFFVLYGKMRPLSYAFAKPFHAIGEPMKLRMLALCLFLVLSPTTARAFEGPLQVRNQFPLFIGIDPPYFESAIVQDAVSINLTHSSVYVIEEKQPWVVDMDLETTELNLRLKKKTSNSTEVGLDLPFLRTEQGFLDRPVAWIHETLGTGDYGRHNRPMNEFLYDIKYQGMPVIAPENGKAGLGDVRLTVKQIIRKGSPIVSLLAGLELPTGDANLGFGNGSVDASFAVLVDFDMGKAYHGYVNVGGVFPGDLKGHQTIPLRDYAYGGFGVEAAWWEHFHVIVQTLAQGSPFPKTYIRQVDWPGVLLVMGGRYSFEKSSIEFSLTEDPSTAGTPDFILNISYAMKY